MTTWAACHRRHIHIYIYMDPGIYRDHIHISTFTEFIYKYHLYVFHQYIHHTYTNIYASVWISTANIYPSTHTRHTYIHPCPLHVYIPSISQYLHTYTTYVDMQTSHPYISTQTSQAYKQTKEYGHSHIIDR